MRSDHKNIAEPKVGSGKFYKKTTKILNRLAKNEDRFFIWNKSHSAINKCCSVTWGGNGRMVRWVCFLFLFCFFQRRGWGKTAFFNPHSLILSLFPLQIKEVKKITRALQSYVIKWQINPVCMMGNLEPLKETSLFRTSSWYPQLVCSLSAPCWFSCLSLSDPLLNAVLKQEKVRAWVDSPSSLVHL